MMEDTFIIVAWFLIFIAVANGVLAFLEWVMGKVPRKRRYLI